MKKKKIDEIEERKKCKKRVKNKWKKWKRKKSKLKEKRKKKIIKYRKKIIIKEWDYGLYLIDKRCYELYRLNGIIRSLYLLTHVGLKWIRMMK